LRSRRFPRTDWTRTRCFDKLREAGVSLLGGHTVQDREIKFGYAVTGAIDPARVLSNAGAQPGDVLFLTKPLGTGIVGTAIKFDRAPQPLVDAAVRSMTTLNRAAAEALQRLPREAVHACTDITGFGLAGHGTEMARASGVTLTLAAGRLPLFPGVVAIVDANHSGGLDSNREHFAGGVQVSRGVAEAVEALLYDPQTSGGLLVAADLAAADAVESALRGAGVEPYRIGTAGPAISAVHVVVEP